MEHILDIPSTDRRELRYAGFWIRVGATIIDAIILMFAGLLVGVVAGLVIDMVVGVVVYYVISLVGGVLYHCFMESSERQATYGKIAVGIQVGGSKGERLTFGNALGRYLGKIVSAIPFYIGFMMVGWDSKNQGLHDKMADTYVFFR